MRATTIMLLALSISLLSQAQPARSKFFLRANGSAYVDKSKQQAMEINSFTSEPYYFETDHRIRSLNISIQGGYMFTKRLGGGILFPYTIATTREVANDPYQYRMDVIVRGIGAGLFARYYHPLSSKVFGIAQGDVQRQWSKLERESTFRHDEGGVVYENKNWQGGKVIENIPRLSAGLSYFFTEKISIDLMFRRSWHSVKDGNNTRRWTMDAGFQIFL